MKEIPKIYMQLAMLAFGTIIAASSAFSAWHLSELQYYFPNSPDLALSRIEGRIDQVTNSLKDIDRTLERKI